MFVSPLCVASRHDCGYPTRQGPFSLMPQKSEVVRLAQNGCSIVCLRIRCHLSTAQPPPEPSRRHQLSPLRNRALVGTTLGQRGVDRCAVSGCRQAPQPFTLRKGILIRTAERPFPWEGSPHSPQPAAFALDLAGSPRPHLQLYHPQISSHAVDTGKNRGRCCEELSSN